MTRKDGDEEKQQERENSSKGTHIRKSPHHSWTLTNTTKNRRQNNTTQIQPRKENSSFTVSAQTRASPHSPPLAPPPSLVSVEHLSLSVFSPESSVYGKKCNGWSLYIQSIVFSRLTARFEERIIEVGVIPDSIMRDNVVKNHLVHSGWRF